MLPRGTLYIFLLVKKSDTILLEKGEEGMQDIDYEYCAEITV